MQFVQYLCTLPSNDTYGYIQALPLAKVNVYAANEDGTSGAPAQLYAADGTTPISNPAIADINGFAGFGADDGVYNIQVTDAEGVRNAPLAVKVQLFDQLGFLAIAGVVDQAVIGPVSSTDGHFMLFDGATGAAAKDTGLSLDTDGTLGANSDTRLPSQKAVKTAIAAAFGANDAMIFKGVIDCSANPNYPAADAGHTYKVSVAGKIGGASGVNVQVQDMLVCITDGTVSGNQATVGSAWTIVQANIDGAVVGPASATDSSFARFDGTTGKLLKDGRTLVQLTSDIFMGGALSEQSVASASTVDLVSGITSPKILITGTTTITAFTVPNHSLFLLRFQSSLTLTYNATSLILPGGANIVAQANDTAIITTDGSGNTRVRHYQRAASIPEPAPNPNLLTNPSFDVWQDNTTYTLTTTSMVFSADRWKHNLTGNSGTNTVSRQAGFNGAQYCIRLQRNAGQTNTNAIRVNQQIFTAVATSFGGKTLALTFDWQTGADWSSVTGGTPVFRTGTGTDETVTSSGFPSGNVTTTFSPAFAPAANSSGTYSGTITVPSGITEAMLAITAGAFVGTAGANDWMQITNVKLEVVPTGGVATSFVHPPISATMQECLRVYQKTFLDTTVPVQNAGAATGEYRAAATKAGANAQTLGTLQFKVVMRAAPTVTLYNPAAANAQARDITAAADCSSTTAQNTSTASCEIVTTGNASTAVGNTIGVHATLDARL